MICNKILIRITLIIIIFVICNTLPSFAEVIKIEKSLKEIAIGINVEYLEDREGKLSVEDLKRKDLEEKWIQSKNESIGLGFTKSVVWVRFTVLNATNKDINFYLEQGYPLTDKVDLYIPEKDGTYNIIKAGDSLSFDKRPIVHMNFVFPIKISKNSGEVYFLRYYTTSSMIIMLKIYSPETFNSIRDTEYWILIFLTGIVFVMVIYNLFVYFFIRHTSYLFYSLFILSVGLVFMTLNGLAFQLLWPQYPQWASFCVPSLLASANLFTVSFCLSFLQTKRRLSMLHKITSVWCYIIIAIIILSLIFDTGYNQLFMLLTTLMSLISAIFCLTIGTRLLLKKKREAYHYMLSWILFFTGVAVKLLSTFGIIPANIISQWAWYFGYVAVVILLSIAQADLINVMRRDLQVFSEKLSNLNISLEQKVKERTAKLQMANEKLKEMDKIKSNFFTNISHEIRTPLTLILSPIESVLQGDYDKELDHSFLLNIQRNAIKLLRLINNILDFTKLEAGKMEIKVKEVDIVKMIMILIGSVLSAAESQGITLNFISLNKSVRVFVDIEKAEKIAMNLFSNALKFTKRGGKIEVRIKDDDENCYIEIEDTGEGIPGDKLDLIFDRFSQVDSSLTRNYEGTGIGLSLARELTESIGGRLLVESRHIEKYPNEHGSKFTIIIPKGKEHFEGREDLKFITSEELKKLITDADSQKYAGYSTMHEVKEEGITDEPVSSEDDSRQTLLIVEDNNDMRRFLTFLLKEKYNIHTAVNGEEGIKMTGEIIPDLIISDVMMPIMNGYEMTKRIKKSLK